MIKVLVDGYQLDIEFMTFSGGERHVKIKGVLGDYPLLESSWDSRNWHKNPVDNIQVFAHVDSNDALMDILLVKDALDRMCRGNLRKAVKTLFLPYIPYARQDRAMVDGEPLSSAVFGKVINLAGFDEVVVDDPHSDVAPSHIKNVVIYDQYELALTILGKDFFKGGDLVIVAPDAGAVKKTTKLAQAVQVKDVGIGHKNRDVLTGEITGTSYTGPSVYGRRVLMVDDICDGGATFVHLANALRAEGAHEIALFVTHGIFSKGIDDVFDGVIDSIYTTYAWDKNIVTRNKKEILKLVDATIAFK